jgi:energy-coupling factor transport system permease protein
MHLAHPLTFMPGTSFLHRLDARAKAAWLVMVSIGVFVVGPWGATGAAVILAGLIVMAGGGFSRVGVALRGIALFLVIAFVSNALLQPGTVIARVGYVAVTREGLVAGWLICARLAALVLASAVVSITTSSLELSSALERFFAPSRRIGLEPAEIALVISLTLRAIPMLIDEALELKKSLEARGVRFAGSFRARIYGLYLMFVPLIFLSMRRSEELALAMEARGYHPRRARIWLRDRRWAARDTAFIMLTLVLIGAAWVRGW